MDAFEFRLLIPAPHVRPGDVVPAEGMLALLASARDVVGVEGDERVFLFLRINPFHDPVPDEVREPEATHLQLVHVLAGEHEVAVLHDQQRSPDAAFVAVDDDLAHVLVEAHVYLVAQESRPSPFADLGDEEFRVFVETDQVSVHVDPRELGLLTLHLFRPEVRQEKLDLLLREAFGHIDHEGAVLHQTAVLPFRSLVRTQPTPLGRMEVPGLEVGLGPREGRGNPTEVAQGAHVRRAVQELRHPGPAADPVAGRERMQEPLGEQVRTDGGGNLQLPAAAAPPPVLALFDVRVDDVRHLRRGDDRIVDVLVLLHAEGFHEDDQRNLTGGGRHAHDELAVLLFLHQGERPVPFLLGEHLGDLDLATVPLVELDEHPVRGEVFEGDQGPLRPADDEVAARIDRVLLGVLDQLAAILFDRELPLVFHVLLVKEAAFRLHHDREVPDMDPLRFPLDAIFDDREVEIDRCGVVQVPEAGLHRVQGMRRPVRLFHDREAQRDGRLRLQVDAASVVPLPPDPNLGHIALRAVLVELDDPATIVFGGGPPGVHDSLHPRPRIVDRRKEVVERRDVMVHDRAFPEERVNEFAHVLPPNHETICLRYAGRPAHPRHADDAALLDRPLNLLEDLDHRIALANLRELVSRDLQRLQYAIGVFLGDEPMLWDQLVLQYVKPQGGPPWATDRFPPGMSSAREPCGPAGTFGAPARSAGPVRTPDHPVSFRPPVRGAVKSRMLFLGTVCSPSYLAELRALRLAAATCDLPPNRGLVLKFPVDRRRMGVRKPPGPHNYSILQMKIRRCTMFYTGRPSQRPSSG